MSEKKHPHYSQYLWEPDTEEQKKKKEEQFKAWCETRTAFNIDNRIQYNTNGHKGSLADGPIPLAMKWERTAVHQHAIRKILSHPEKKAWDVYMSVANAYTEYLKKGIPASLDFDPSILDKAQQ